jgi:hypothetical protein
MSLTNGPLQVGVDYMSPSFLGAYNANIPYNIDSYAFGTELTAGTIVPYGSFMMIGTDGAKLPTTAATPANLLGILAYGVNGVTQEAGLQVGGLYKVAPLLNFGRIWVKVTSGATLAIGDVVSLNLAATAQFNTVRPLPGSPASTDIDISSIARVSQPSNADGMVELTLTHYLN